MSFVSPITNSISTSTKPTTAARSMTRNGTGLPRTFSTRLQKMWPPSSGRNGNRLISAEREADHGEHDQRLAGVELERLPGHLVAPTTPEICSRFSASKIRATIATVCEVTSHMRSTDHVGGLADRRDRAAALP